MHNAFFKEEQLHILSVFLVLSKATFPFELVT